MQAINAAYEVLGDTARRAAYDRECGDASAEDSFFSEADDKDNEFRERWQIAAKYCADAEIGFKYLEKLSSRLAFSFASFLLETQNFDQCKKAIRKFQDKFLSSYFGDNAEIQRFARQLLLCGERTAAKSLNSAVKVLGKSLRYDALYKVVSNDYPEAIKKVLYFNVLYPDDRGETILLTCSRFLRAMSVEYEHVGALWGDKLVIQWDGNSLRVPGEDSCKWAFKHFDTRPEFKEVWKGPNLWQ